MAESDSTLQMILDLQDEASAKLAQAQQAVKDYATTVDGAGSTTEKTNSSFDNMTAAVFKGTAAWDLLKKGVSAVTGFLEDAVKEAYDYDASLAQIAGKLNQIGPAAAAQLPAIDSFLQAFTKIGVADNAAADAFNVLIKASGDVDLSMKLTKAASDLTSSGFYDLQTNATFLANVLTGHGQRAAIAYKLELSDTATTADYLNAILGKVTLTTEDWAKTTQGQLSVIHEDYVNLQQAVGEGLINAFYGFTTEAVADMNKTQDSLNTVSDDVAIFGIEAGGAFALMVDGLKSIVQVLYGLAEVEYHAFTALVDGAKAAYDAVHTHFSDAKTDIDKSKEEFDKAGTALTDTFTKIGKDADDAGKHWQDMTDPQKTLNDIKTVRLAQEMADAAAKEEAIKTADRQKKAQEDAKALAEAITKLKTTYLDFTAKSKDAFADMADSEAKELKTVQDSIASTKASMDELTKSYNQTQADDQKSLAEKIVDAQQQIKDDTKALLTETDADKRASLQKEINDTQATLTQNAGLIQSMSQQIADAQKRASESELQRTIDDYFQKRLMAQAEYADKMQKLKDELNAENQNQLSIMALYGMRQTTITDILTQGEEDYKKIMNAHYQTTKETVDKETTLLNNLASLLSSTKSAGLSSLGNINSQIPSQSVHDAIITPQGIVHTDPDDFIIATKTPGSLGGGVTQTSGGNITININNPTVRRQSDLDEMRKMLDKVTRDLPQQRKIKSY